MPPRSKAAARKKARAAVASGAKKGKSAPQLSASQLYEQAQIAMQFDDVEGAAEALRRAVKLEPDNAELLEAYGSLLAETGDGEQAESTLRRCVELRPDAGHEKYMYLGQLLDGEEALAMTKRGIELLQTALDAAKAAKDEPHGGGGGGAAGASMGEDSDDADVDADADASVDDLAAQACSALCSLAEMLMGSADSMDAVAEEVEALLRRAASTCPDSPEPGQAMCSLRYEQGRPEEALAQLTDSMKKWFRPAKGGQDDDDDDDDEDVDEGGNDKMGADGAGPSGGGDDTANEAVMQPSYEFRFECAKLLLELSDTTEVAIQVLEDMVEEDDSNPHTWHLLGMAYYGGGLLDEATEIHEQGLKLLKKLGVPEDEEVYDDFDDLKGAIDHARAEGMEAA